MRYAIVLILMFLCLGCANKNKTPQLGNIYNRAAQDHGPHRNPVIVIPGILGSRLVDNADGQIVWGAFSGKYANPETPEGAQLIALPMAQGKPLRELTDDVRPDGALDRLRVDVLFLPVELNAYREILATLGVGGYTDEELTTSGLNVDYGDDHFTCFQFPYDWRRDNVENARALDAFIKEKRKLVQQQLAERYGAEDVDVKFDIVAHSMGGLVARYFLRYGDADLPADSSAPRVTWAGAEHVNKAILVATPNAGSILATQQLVNGVRLAPILPEYSPAVLGTMPSIYQLIPRHRQRPLVWPIPDLPRETTVGMLPPPDPFDIELWQRKGWGLASPDIDEQLSELLPNINNPAIRRAVALDHLRKCLERAERFQASIDTPANPPDGLELHLIVGDAESTAAQATVEIDGRLSITSYAPGDGTVLRSSALMDERVGQAWSPYLRSPIKWNSVRFIFQDHLGLTQDPNFTDNVLYLLLEQPPTDQ